MEVLGGAGVRVEPSDWVQARETGGSQAMGWEPMCGLVLPMSAHMGLTSALAGIMSGPW